MLVRFFWPNCDLLDDDSSVDCFWVECTKEEALEHVFPMLSKQRQVESIEWAKSDDTESNLERNHCYLVSPDLSHIIAKPAFFPFSGQWNAYNPFRGLANAIDINSLDNLRAIHVKEQNHG